MSLLEVSSTLRVVITSLAAALVTENATGSS
jgi:hypothetical protein